MLALETPKLIVPEEIRPTRGDREWSFPLFGGKNPFWQMFLAIPFAILLSILIFMDHQITGAKYYNIIQGGLRATLFFLILIFGALRVKIFSDFSELY